LDIGVFKQDQETQGGYYDCRLFNGNPDLYYALNHGLGHKKE
jgi:hypothetical protein